jgi:serine/threonine protein kinase
MELLPKKFQDEYTQIHKLEGKNTENGIILLVQNNTTKCFHVLKANFNTDNESRIYDKLPRDSPYILYPEMYFRVNFKKSKIGEILIYPYYQRGDLFNILSCVKYYIAESDIHRIFGQIYEGTLFLHKNNILHLDLKLENILVDNDGNIKICDFDLSKEVDISIERHYTAKEFGTYDLMSPEMYNDKYFGEKSDVWGLGEILSRILFNESLYDESFEDKKSINIKKELMDKCDTEYDRSLSILLIKLLQPDPAERYTMEELKTSEWMTKTF